MPKYYEYKIAWRVIFTSYCFSWLSRASILNFSNQSCKHLISRRRLISLCLCIANGHSRIELIIRHLTPGLRIICGHTRPEWKSIPEDDLPIEHIDCGGSRNAKV